MASVAIQYGLYSKTKKANFGLLQMEKQFVNLTESPLKSL